MVNSSIRLVDNGDGTFSLAVADQSGVGNAALRMVGVQLTRPANTIAYAAGDVIAPATPAVLAFDAAVPANGGAGTIVKLKVVTSKKVDQSRYALHVYSVAPTAVADNAAMPFLVANASRFQGMIQTEPADTGRDVANSTGAFAVSRGEELPFVCAGGDDALYGHLVILDDANTDSGQTYTVEILVK